MLISTKEARITIQDTFQIGKSTFYKNGFSGRLKLITVNVNGIRRVSREDLESLIAELWTEAVRKKLR